MIDVALLGTGGMMPLPNRWLASAALRIEGEVVLFDCGEGTQISNRLHGFGFRSISSIFISHVHGDHVLGLPGMLFMIAQSGREETLRIFGPTGVLAIVQGLTVVVPGLPFPVEVIELEGGERFAVGQLEVSCLLVDHHVPCLAYRVDRRRKPRFSVTAATELGVPKQLWRTLQAGESVTWESGSVEPAQVMGPPRSGLAVGYTVDTRPTPELPEFMRGVDLLICEGTFADPAQADRAVERKHMLFAEAADVAAGAGVRRLWLTHFSPALTQPEGWSDQATGRFENTTVGYDGLSITLNFPDQL